MHFLLIALFKKVRSGDKMLCILKACFRLCQVEHKIYCSQIWIMSQVLKRFYGKEMKFELLPHSHIFAAFYPAHSSLQVQSHIFIF